MSNFERLAANWKRPQPSTFEIEHVHSVSRTVDP
jgi:hypothetical protein